MQACIDLSVRSESWPLAQVFKISRGAKTSAEVVVVELRQGGCRGWGECVPYPRYGESVESVIAQVEAMRDALSNGLDRLSLQQAMAPGAARNALDCAFWDLEAKRSRTPVWRLAGLGPPQSVVTAYTISLGAPEEMGASAAANADRPLMKLKLTGAGDLERVSAVRQNAPDAALIVDANEGWTPEMVEPYARDLKDLGVSMIEQPLPADQDAALADLDHPVPFCADESAHTRDGIEALARRYDMINIKLDKTGGLTEALRLKQAARDAGMGIMVGCMVGTSLAMAPAVLLAQGAEIIDLDGPLLMARDREPGLRYEGSRLAPPDPTFWG